MSRPSVAIITLGCARNEVDSEELAGRLAAEGWDLVDDAEQADAVLVNTCGFVDVAKKDSIDAILAASDLKSGAHGPQAVVAVGCLSERYGSELAAELPEADAVLGFDDYPDIAARLRRIVAGERPAAHEPTDRRLLLPIAPVDRDAAQAHVPGHGDAIAPRRRLALGPVASVKLASGCDRRCAFCAIPTFRGSFVSRTPAEVLAEISELVRTGVREVVLVSENSTSYGKDLGDLRLLETALPQLAVQSGIARLRVAYLQPAEIRPGLIEVMAQTEQVAPYFDLSFQHASATVLRRMRRFGGTEAFLGLIERIRALEPEAGIRSNVIVGFPGETQADVDELASFLEQARLDAIGVFGYSDEDGTEALTLPDKIAAEEIRVRVERISALADEVMAQRAEDRIGTTVSVLVERFDTDDDGGLVAVGHAGHQGPDDAETFIAVTEGQVAIGDFVSATVIDVDGVDLIADPA
ncbi:MAG: 30S ribosomal protein S12 methylthiotransferase RimO [Candidatus Nanopelagicales bacterium]|nr:30S ribosomal protein S12 methylthiotransferase RimO [Candidatus Nanopelagicales bacterium]